MCMHGDDLRPINNDDVSVDDDDDSVTNHYEYK